MTRAPFKPSRRVFLVTTSTVACASVAARVLPGCGTGASSVAGPQSTGYSASNLAVGESVVPPGANYILARDANGFYAYSDRCTHQGCSVPAPTNGVSICPCHQAHFDANGDNTAGPDGGARIANLQHYQVSMSTSGELVVDTSAVQPDRAARFVPTEAPPATDGGDTDGGTPDAGTNSGPLS